MYKRQGSFGGSLKDVPSSELGAIVIKEAVNRAGIKPELVEEVVMGNVIQAAQGQNVARQAAVKAGLPVEVPAMTINKVCGSGLRCVALAAQMIKAGAVSYTHLVDEVQFFKANQIDELFKVAVCLDIPVICYGLRTDFKMEGFEGSTRLLLLAHSIEELKTICKCGKKAILNGRKINNKFVFEGQQVAIDNVDNVEYESLCGHCYFKYKNE